MASSSGHEEGSSNDSGGGGGGGGSGSGSESNANAGMSGNGTNVSLYVPLNRRLQQLTPCRIADGGSGGVNWLR
jgi:hypothetical protein